MVFCLLVAVQIITYANYLFATWGVDTFVYSGFIVSLPHHLQNFPDTYYGARLPWLLPGYILTRGFGAFFGLVLLNVLFSLAIGCSAYFWFYSLFGFRYGLLLGVLMICLPEVAFQATWNYVSLPCSTYILASLAFSEASVQPSRNRFQRTCLLLLAGWAVASAIMTNLAVVLLLPALTSYHFVRSRGSSIQEMFADSMGVVAGILATVFFYCLIYFKLTGSLDIFGPALRYAGHQPHPNPWYPIGFGWIKHAVWLILPALAGFVSVGFLFQRSADRRERSKYLALASGTLLGIASFVSVHFLGTPLLNLSYYTCMLLPFYLGTLIALIGKLSSLQELNRGMLLGALVAASPVGVLFVSCIFRELFSTNASLPITIWSIAAVLTIVAFWRPLRAIALVLLLLVPESAFVVPNGDGRYILHVPFVFKDVPRHLFAFNPVNRAPAEFFSEYLRAHNYIYNTTGFKAPCFLVESQPNNDDLLHLSTAVLSSYLYGYSMLDFNRAGFCTYLLKTRRYLAVLGNSAAWRDQQFQRLRELVPGVNFVFDSETVLHYKDRALGLALYSITP